MMNTRVDGDDKGNKVNFLCLQKCCNTVRAIIRT